jgi:dTMP kinase
MFITFEGGEGSGKTTIIEKIILKLSELDFTCYSSREPGGSAVAEKIRELVLDPEYTGITARTEALLYAASRAQHLDDIIIPKLKEGYIVICDRYLDSSIAYQAFGRELGMDFILSINKYALDYMPNITFYIDIIPEIGLSRIKGRSKRDRLDREKEEFHIKVREGYLKVAQIYKNRIIVIDGKKDIDTIVNEIFEEIITKI